MNDFSQENLLPVLVLGVRDFSRRVTSYFENGKNTQMLPFSFIGGNPSELASLTASERPVAIVIEIGLQTDRQELSKLKGALQKIRKDNTSIILAITSSLKMAYAGDLLFADEDSLKPSGLIDDMVCSPPPGTPTILSLEAQIEDALTYVIPEKETDSSLPSLWDDNWVPSICDPASREIWKLWLPRYARYTQENPLIVGPTGSGKTRLANACHVLSGLSGPFISITPRDFSSSELVQAELFGSVTGAFTGAIEKWGLVKKADKGTLFVDELQSIDLELQGKLITFIENKEYRRVGESDRHKANVRFIFASNRPLDALVREGKLRDDFAYRLERLQIPLLPLEQRRLDILAGAAFSVAKILRERNILLEQDQTESLLPVEGISLEAYRLLFSSDWPGNLRQIENAIAKCVETCMITNRRIIEIDDLHSALSGLLGEHSKGSVQVLCDALLRAAAEISAIDKLPCIEDAQNSLAKHARSLALENTGGDIEAACELIGDSNTAMTLFSNQKIEQTNKRGKREQK
jgi:DNA-binding NtrC family response regulator